MRGPEHFSAGEDENPGGGVRAAGKKSHKLIWNSTNIVIEKFVLYYILKREAVKKLYTPSHFFHMAHPHTWAYTYAHAHRNTHTHRHTHTSTQKHTETHANTRKHTHTHGNAQLLIITTGMLETEQASTGDWWGWLSPSSTVYDHCNISSTV